MVTAKGIMACHEKAPYHVSVRVQNCVWEVETEKEGC